MRDLIHVLFMYFVYLMRFFKKSATDKKEMLHTSFPLILA